MLMNMSYTKTLEHLVLAFSTVIADIIKPLLTLWITKPGR